jgi:alpha/beta superfamily hydrolase
VASEKLSAGIVSKAFTVIPKNIVVFLPFAMLFTLMAGMSSCASAVNEPSDHGLEESVCGLKEPLVFWLWSLAAGSADHSRALDAGNVEDVSLTTGDGRRIRGYKLSASGSTKPPAEVKGYLLVAQGNAMLADQIISSFKSFARKGYDVYIFDYRGYGRSQGKRRLKAILNDYREIIAHLNALSYPRRLYYGMSFGGIVLLDVLEQGDHEKSVVIDSTPSRVSDYGCPQVYDPVNNLPEDSSDFLFISGDRDPVVSFDAARELLELARQRGAAVLRDRQFSHPFMDTSMEDHNRRRRAVERFLLGGQTEQP